MNETTESQKRAVVLLSGGLDSCVTAAIALSRGRAVSALGIAYGQRHSCELDAARHVASYMGVPLHLVSVDIAAIVGSALLGSCAVSKGRSIEAIRADATPSTFVPARNAMFLSIASAFAVSIQAQEVWVGSNADDANGYPDCRPEFFRAFEQVSRDGGFQNRRRCAVYLRISTPIDCCTRRVYKTTLARTLPRSIVGSAETQRSASLSITARAAAIESAKKNVI